ncbi:rRNA maturation RNase YbeY [Ureaplasma canigenitalium]|uniref:rRNA maturation RNase YbeY n=1 Tax=Ureaplasma canigenitalium TaxID=42092 RepID=UPI0004E1F476|nr:rRNA maturation RNase YbeY [Ureaplasma canigenitalium]
MEINIYSSVDEFDTKTYKPIFDNIAAYVFSKLKLNTNRFLEVNIVDRAEIRVINHKYRNKDRETDVISFAFDESGFISFALGEIYICYPVAVDQAKEYQHSVYREINFLFTHGLLHVLGYDHIEEDDAAIMFGFQDEILDYFKIMRG